MADHLGRELLLDAVGWRCSSETRCRAGPPQRRRRAGRIQLVDASRNLPGEPGWTTVSLSDDGNSIMVGRMVASPDGAWLAVERAARVELWNAAERTLLGEFPAEENWVDATVQFDAAGQRFSTVTGDRVVIRELPSGREVSTEHVTDALEVGHALQRGLGGIRIVRGNSQGLSRIWMVWARGERLLAQARWPAFYQTITLTTAGSAALIQSGDSAQQTLTTYDLSGPEPVEVGSIVRSTSVFALSVSDRGRHVVLDCSVLAMISGVEAPLTGGDGLTSGISSVLISGEEILVRQVEPTREATGTVRTSLLVWDARAGRLSASGRNRCSSSGPGRSRSRRSCGSGTSASRPSGRTTRSRSGASVLRIGCSTSAR